MGGGGLLLDFGRYQSSRAIFVLWIYILPGGRELVYNV